MLGPGKNNLATCSNKYLLLKKLDCETIKIATLGRLVGHSS